MSDEDLFSNDYEDELEENDPFDDDELFGGNLDDLLGPTAQNEQSFNVEDVDIDDLFDDMAAPVDVVPQVDADEIKELEDKIARKQKKFNKIQAKLMKKDIKLEELTQGAKFDALDKDQTQFKLNLSKADRDRIQYKLKRANELRSKLAKLDKKLISLNSRLANAKGQLMTNVTRGDYRTRPKSTFMKSAVLATRNAAPQFEAAAVGSDDKERSKITKFKQDIFKVLYDLSTTSRKDIVDYKLLLDKLIDSIPAFFEKNTNIISPELYIAPDLPKKYWDGKEPDESIYSEFTNLSDLEDSYKPAAYWNGYIKKITGNPSYGNARQIKFYVIKDGKMKPITAGYGERTTTQSRHPALLRGDDSEIHLLDRSGVPSKDSDVARRGRTGPKPSGPRAPLRVSFAPPKVDSASSNRAMRNVAFEELESVIKPLFTTIETEDLHSLDAGSTPMKPRASKKAKKSGSAKTSSARATVVTRGSSAVLSRSLQNRTTARSRQLAVVGDGPSSSSPPSLAAATNNALKLLEGKITPGITYGEFGESLNKETHPFLKFIRFKIMGMSDIQKGTKNYLIPLTKLITSYFRLENIDRSIVPSTIAPLYERSDDEEDDVRPHTEKEDEVFEAVTKQVVNKEYVPYLMNLESVIFGRYGTNKSEYFSHIAAIVVLLSGELKKYTTALQRRISVTPITISRLDDMTLASTFPSFAISATYEDSRIWDEGFDRIKQLVDRKVKFYISKMQSVLEPGRRRDADREVELGGFNWDIHIKEMHIICGKSKPLTDAELANTVVCYDEKKGVFCKHAKE
jgi:hypothetical protein